MLIKKVLIGIDDSKHAEHAAEYGFDIARKFGAEVGLVNIIEPVIIPQNPGGMDPIMGASMVGAGIEEMEILDIQKSQSENTFDRIIKELSGGMPVTHFTEYGSSADGIISCSKEFKADLIVIGTHSRTGFDRLFMGSVSEHVVRHAEVPVLVVPMKEA